MSILRAPPHHPARPDAGARAQRGQAFKPTSPIDRKRLTVGRRKGMLEELERSAVARRRRLSSIKKRIFNLGARPPTQDGPHPAVMLLSDANFAPSYGNREVRFRETRKPTCETHALPVPRRHHVMVAHDRPVRLRFRLRSTSAAAPLWRDKSAWRAGQDFPQCRSFERTRQLLSEPCALRCPNQPGCIFWSRAHCSIPARFGLGRSRRQLDGRKSSWQMLPAEAVKQRKDSFDRVVICFHRNRSEAILCRIELGTRPLLREPQQPRSGDPRMREPLPSIPKE
jgi:hypothetical protein